MKTLIIDDDLITRSQILHKYWLAGPEDRVEWLTEWPSDFIGLLESDSDITHISLDHDLGHTDTALELSRLMFLEPERLSAVLKGRHVVIHSMNSVGANNLFNKLYHFCRSVSKIPFHVMNTADTK